LILIHSAALAVRILYFDFLGDLGGLGGSIIVLASWRFSLSDRRMSAFIGG
jgi:hypothetical protein